MLHCNWCSSHIRRANQMTSWSHRVQECSDTHYRFFFFFCIQCSVFFLVPSHNDNRSLCAQVGRIARHIGVEAPQFVVILKCFVWIVTSALWCCTEVVSRVNSDTCWHWVSHLDWNLLWRLWHIEMVNVPGRGTQMWHLKLWDITRLQLLLFVSFTKLKWV